MTMQSCSVCFQTVRVSHVIRAVCDRVLVMKNGGIIEEGSTDEVFNSPVDSYTKLLLESRPGKLNFAS